MANAEKKLEQLRKTAWPQPDVYPFKEKAEPYKYYNTMQLNAFQSKAMRGIFGPFQTDFKLFDDSVPDIMDKGVVASSYGGSGGKGSGRKSRKATDEMIGEVFLEISGEVLREMFSEVLKEISKETSDEISDEIAGKKSDEIAGKISGSALRKVLGEIPSSEPDKVNPDQSLPWIYKASTGAKSGLVVMPKGSGKTALAVMLAVFMGRKIRYCCRSENAYIFKAYMKRWCRIVEYKRSRYFRPVFISYITDICSYEEFPPKEIGKDNIIIFDDFENRPNDLMERWLKVAKGTYGLVLVLANDCFDGYEQYGELLYDGSDRIGCTMLMIDAFYSAIPFEIDEESKSELYDLMNEDKDVALCKKAYNVMAAHEKAGHKILITAPKEFGRLFSFMINDDEDGSHFVYRGRVGNISSFENKRVQTFFMDDALIGVEVTSLPVFDCFIQIGRSSDVSIKTRLVKFFTGADLDAPPAWVMRTRKGYFYELVKEGQQSHVLQSLRAWKKETGMKLWEFDQSVSPPAKFPDLAKDMMARILADKKIKDSINRREQKRLANIN